MSILSLRNCPKALLLALVGYTTATAVTIGSPQSLGVLGAFSDCAVDVSGDLHVVYRFPPVPTDQNEAVRYVKFLTSKWEGDSTPLRVLGPEVAATNTCDWQFSLPQIAVDGDCLPHVVWGTGRPWKELYYRKRSRTGWDPVEILVHVDPPGIVSHADVGIDPKGAVHVTYKHRTIQYVSKNKGPWSKPVTVSSEGIKKSPRLAVGPDGSVHVIYIPDKDPHLSYNKRSPAGDWGKEEILAPFGARPEYHDIVTDSKGVPHIVAVPYATKKKGRWVSADVPTDGAIGERDEWEHAPLARIGITDSGKLFAVWLDFDQLKYSSYEDGNWSPDAVLSTPPGNPAWPSLEVRGEAGYVVYKNDADETLYVNRIRFDKSGPRRPAERVRMSPVRAER